MKYQEVLKWNDPGLQDQLPKQTYQNTSCIQAKEENYIYKALSSEIQTMYRNCVCLKYSKRFQIIFTWLFLRSLIMKFFKIKTLNASWQSINLVENLTRNIHQKSAKEIHLSNI